MMFMAAICAMTIGIATHAHSPEDREPRPASQPGAAPAGQAPPAPAHPEKPAQKPPQRPASLDELLGLPNTSGAGGKAGEPEKTHTGTTEPAGTPAGPDGPDAELDRLLSGREIAEAFEQAVELMGDASTRLNHRNDPGLDTQRIQEDVIKKLDLVLDQLEQQQQQSSSSSKQKSRERSRQNVPSRPEQSRGSSQPTSGDNQTESMAPARQDGRLNPSLDSARAAWGALPERVRDLLLQGSGDRFSSKYQAMTEAYYRKLAEERKP